MGLKSLLGALFASEKAAPTELQQLAERVDGLETAFSELSEQAESVIERVRSWSAREAGRRRHEATKNLDQMMSASTDESAAEGQPDGTTREATRLQEFADQRAAAKAAIARRMRGAG